LSFVGAAEHLEEGLGSGLGEGDVTELVEDEETVPGKSVEEPFELPVVAGFEALGGERSSGMGSDVSSVGAGGVGTR